MKHRPNDLDKKPEHWQTMTPKSRNLFVVLPLIPRVIIIALVLSAYYLITKNAWFPQWSTYIYYGVKIIIAYEILAASARTILAPILTLLTGIMFLFTSQLYAINLISLSDTWQLLIVALIGFLVTIIVKL